MAWIAGAIAVGGALLSNRSSSRAADTAAEGSERDIEYLTESRDLARSDQAPYREAGYTALDALMSMTGLKTPTPSGGGVTTRGTGAGPGTRFSESSTGVNASDYMRGLGGGVTSRVGRRLPRYSGGVIGNANQYTINEIGPENVYEGGGYTRSQSPRTIAPSRDGYVRPTGRALGGPMMGNYRYGEQPMSHDNGMGSVIDNNTGNVVNPPSATPSPAPMENPGGVEGGYNFMTDPGYDFRLSEGQRALERGGAAAGGLLSGGYGRRLTRYAQDYASNEYTNVYNRISNIAGLGQVSANNTGNYAMMAGQGMGSAAAQAGYARASGYAATGNAITNAANQLGEIDWGGVFGGKKEE